jgi:hypothetical protein
VAFNVLNALARMIARESGADGRLAPRWCDVETIARWACESSMLDVREAIGALMIEKIVTGSLQDGLTIAPDLWADYVNERLRKRLQRESKTRTATEEISAGPEKSCSHCTDGMLLRENGRFAKCCTCPRGRELAGLVYAQREGEREAERRRKADTAERSTTAQPSGIQQELDGVLGRRKAGGDA